MDHSLVLVIAYAAACAAWWGLSRALPLWPARPDPSFPHPWRELGLALAAVVGVLLIGQLYARGIRLEASGIWRPVTESVNQMLIFLPIVALPVVRRHGWASAWIRHDELPLRLLVGVSVALFALAIYSTLERDAPSWVTTIREVFRPGRAHFAVQVLLEDLGIAILFVRLAAALGARRAVIGVAMLFALGHVPSMLTTGALASEFVGLVRDFGLGILVVGTVRRAADIAWLWPVHYALDMTQYVARAAGGSVSP
jgi:hypothetical protein